jgi:hypothetical protein
MNGQTSLQIDSIVVGERHRSDIDALAASIAEREASS